MRRREQRRERLHHRVGIRWRLFVSLAIFTVAILVGLWVFQIRLLGYFYEREKVDELQDITDDLAAYVTETDLDERVDSYSFDKHICIRVFRLKSENEGLVAEKIADCDVSDNCMIHHLSEDLLSELYDKAKQNGGSYDERMELSLGDKSGEEGFYVPGMRPRVKTVNAIHVEILRVDEQDYLVLLDSELTPLDATIKTLQVQFSWIALFLLLGVLLLTFFLSHIIASPLTAITAKAGKLAEGNYEADFEGRGYREARELAEALNFAAREIGATDRLQKELIANISHDLRTPLTMIRGYGEMLRDIPGENTPENVQVIIDEANRLSELVSDLMDLSKLQAGTQKPTPTRFDLTEVVRDAMQRYEALVRHDGYRIELALAGEAPVLADRTMILQVIYNLINNAVNYTGEGRRVRVTETVSEGRVRLSVADDGEGIPPDKIGEIWDRYYRVDRIHKRAVMGTGLGLSIVKSVLEAHHASYGVDSAVGVGSVFWFELPLAESPCDGEKSSS